MSDVERTKDAVREAKTILTDSSFALNTARDKYTEAQGNVTAALDVIARLGAAIAALTKNSESTAVANNKAIQHAEDAIVALVSLGLDDPSSPRHGQELLGYASRTFGSAQLARDQLAGIHEVTERWQPSEFQAIKDALTFVGPCIATSLEGVANTQQATLDSVEAATQYIQNL